MTYCEATTAMMSFSMVMLETTDSTAVREMTVCLAVLVLIDLC
jgi:hypothetical protein